MSSESGESQASAHNEHGDAIENGQDAGEHVGEQEHVVRETTPAQDVGEEADGDQDPGHDGQRRRRLLVCQDKKKLSPVHGRGIGFRNVNTAQG